MYKKCRTEQSSQRQKQIADTFLRLLSVRSYEKISISELCQEARIPRKSFYRYFDSKWDVFLLAVDLMLIDFTTRTDSGNDRKTRSPEEEIAKIFSFFLERKQFLDLVKRDHLSALFFQRIVEQTLSEHVGFRFVVSDHTERQIQMSMMFSVTGLLTLLWDWHQRGCQESPEEMGRIITPMLTVPLFYRAD